MFLMSDFILENDPDLLTELTDSKRVTGFLSLSKYVFKKGLSVFMNLHVCKLNMIN